MEGKIRLRIYLETTVFNYYFDTERKRHEDVVKLFEAIKAGKFEVYTSQYVTEELRKASEPKRSKMLSLIGEYGIKEFSTNDTVLKLSEKYIAAGIIPKSQVFDSLHITLASVYELDVIISYNFSHINRDKTKKYMPLINIREDLRPIVICTAKEVLYNGGNSGDGSDRG